MASEIPPQLQNRIEAIRRRNGYASDTDVIAAALDALAGPEAATEDSDAEASLAKPRRQRAALGIWGAQCLVASVATVAGIIDIESIVGTGPALAACGLALAVVTRPLGSPVVVLFALSGPLVVVFGATLIFTQGWGPPAAQVPLSTLLTLYFLVAAPWAVVVLRRLRAWTAAPLLPLNWQFSMKSLIGTMTVVCLLLVMLRLAMTLRGERFGFAMFSLTLFVVTGLILYWQSDRLGGRRRANRPSESPFQPQHPPALAGNQEAREL